jgi:hypothetical protein
MTNRMLENEPSGISTIFADKRFAKPAVSLKSSLKCLCIATMTFAILGRVSLKQLSRCS